MPRLAALSLTLVTGIALLAPPAAGGPASPLDDANPLGTISWLPTNANERPAANLFRLVVVYDRSRNPGTGQPADLLAKGPFGVKFTTTSPNVRMMGHSPRVTSLDDTTGQPQMGAVDQVFMGVAGDVRDGQCSKVGTAAFSAAYSTTRTFFWPGSTPYTPISAQGTCEVVDASTPLMDGEGNITGYDTRVTNHVPGFWIDVQWPTLSVPQVSTGRFLAEMWYGSYYDDDGENGAWYAVGDAIGTSTTIGTPGEYDYIVSFTAQAGAIGAPCPGFPGLTASPAGTWQDIEIEVPAGTTRVTFRLWPKADWDLRIEDPTGLLGDSGNWHGFEEQEIVPSTGQGNIASLTPGTFVMRGCNYTGEQTVLGGVIIE
jgi:hypothetical protein